MTRRKATAHGPEAKAARGEAQLNIYMERDYVIIDDINPEYEAPRLNVPFTARMEAKRRKTELNFYLNRWVFEWYVRRNEVLFYYRKMRDEHFMFRELEQAGVMG